MVVFSGTERRRRWSGDENETASCRRTCACAVASEVARTADLRAGQINRERRDLAIMSEAEVAAMLVGADVQERFTPATPAAAMVTEIGRPRV